MAPNRHGQSDTGRNFIAAAAKQTQAYALPRVAFGLTIGAAYTLDDPSIRR